MTEQPKSERVYRVPRYLTTVYGSAGAMGAIGLAAIALYWENRGLLAAGPLGIFAVYFAFGLYTQQWEPYRVVVTQEGLHMNWTLGVRDVPWGQVAEITMPPHRFKPGQVAQIEIRLKRGGKVRLVNSLSDFDDLVRRIRELRPDLIHE